MSYTDWNPDRFIREASLNHSDVASYIKRVPEEKTHPEQACKSCRGIPSLARRAGHKRLVNACRRADSYGLYNYPAIERILNSRQDELPPEEDRETERDILSHDNIRGKEYYK